MMEEMTLTNNKKKKLIRWVTHFSKFSEQTRPTRSQPQSNFKFYLFTIMVRIPLGIDKSLRFTKRSIHTVDSYSLLFSKVSLETDGAYTPRCESWGVPILESNNHGQLGVDIGKPEWLSKVCILQGNDIGRNLIHTVSDPSTLLGWKLWNCHYS